MMSNMKKQPNIILLVLDTHRYDRLATYGYQRHTSPNIDAFARQATVFENGISPAQWTIPSHASLFTGEYPTTHQTIQAHLSLDSRFDTLATLLTKHGYNTIGFCNNPLVGILNNGLKRGFNTFYNYSGAVPSKPRSSNHLPNPFNSLWEWYTQQLRKVSYPIQNAFARSDFLFRLSLNPLFVPIWTRMFKFKGDTAQTLRDVRDYLAHVNDTKSDPQFVFINLMETHLPYTPPETFIDKFAPYFKEDRQVRTFMRNYNTQAFRWLMPMDERFKEMEFAILNDMYDSEVAYQDHLLSELLEFLCRPEIADDTLTIIVSDHGEGLGEHDFMGHSFVAYQELVHVPLIIKFPQNNAADKRISNVVSTRRIFHTILSAAGANIVESKHRPTTDVRQLSLARTVQMPDPENEIVFAEAYAPNTFLSMMETHAPQLIETFHCKVNRRASFHEHDKLVRVDGVKNELFNLATDPLEENNIIHEHPQKASKLSYKLDSFMTRAVARRPENWQANKTLNIEDDETLRQQLRALGYLE